MACNTFTMLRNHHLYLVPEHFYHPNKKFCTHSAVLNSLLLPALATTNPSVWTWICLFWTLHIHGMKLGLKKFFFCVISSRVGIVSVCLTHLCQIPGTDKRCGERGGSFLQRMSARSLEAGSAHQASESAGVQVPQLPLVRAVLPVDGYLAP